mgnify:CR=1 FL=1
MRFSREFDVSGYDPEEYYRQYRDAGSDINNWRRIDYAANRERINAQKRAAYAARKGSTTGQQTHQSAAGAAVDQRVAALTDPAAKLLHGCFQRRVIALAGSQIYCDLHRIAPFPGAVSAGCPLFLFQHTIPPPIVQAA